MKGNIQLELISSNCKNFKCLKMYETFPKTKFNTITSVLASEISFPSLESYYGSFYTNFGSSPMIMLTAKYYSLCKLYLESINFRFLGFVKIRNSLKLWT